MLTTPIDVVKTRIMLSAGSKPSASASASALTIGKEIFRSEGIKGLFRGGALRGVWTALGSGLYLGVYESGRNHLEIRRQKTGTEG